MLRRQCVGNEWKERFGPFGVICKLVELGWRSGVSITEVMTELREVFAGVTKRSRV